MRELFDSELERIKEISKYNKKRASEMLDDMGTAYISVSEFDHLDKALIAVRTAKKSLRAQGFNNDYISDYFIQRSYLSKTTLRQLRNESIFTGEGAEIKEEITNKLTCNIAMFDNRTTTDLIIEVLHSKPELLSCLQRHVSKQYLSKRFEVTQPTILIDFYNKHKEIIDN